MHQWGDVDGGRYVGTLKKFHEHFGHHDALKNAHHHNTRAAYATGDNVYNLLSTAIPHYKSHDPLITSPTSVEDYNESHNQLKLNNSSSHAFKKLNDAHLKSSINAQRRKLIGPEGQTLITQRPPIKDSNGTKS